MSLFVSLWQGKQLISCTWFLFFFYRYSTGKTGRSTQWNSFTLLLTWVPFTTTPESLNAIPARWQLRNPVIISATELSCTFTPSLEETLHFLTCTFFFQIPVSRQLTFLTYFFRMLWVSWPEKEARATIQAVNRPRACSCATVHVLLHRMCGYAVTHISGHKSHKLSNVFHTEMGLAENTSCC